MGLHFDSLITSQRLSLQKQLHFKRGQEQWSFDVGDVPIENHAQE
jgi:hypothetical protein